MFCKTTQSKMDPKNSEKLESWVKEKWGPLISQQSGFQGYYLIVKPDGEFAFEPLSGAQAGLALMECLVNARNLPGHGLAEAARLARNAPAFRLRYSHFEQIGDRIQAFLS